MYLFRNEGWIKTFAHYCLFLNSKYIDKLIFTLQRDLSDSVFTSTENVSSALFFKP